MKHQFVKKIEIGLLIISAILIGGSAYFIGKMQSTESQSNGIQIVYPDAIAIKDTMITDSNQSNNSFLESNLQATQTNQTGNIVASKNGTRYYYSHCGGIGRIKPENRIYFDTKEQAEAKGLTLASGCKSL